MLFERPRFLLLIERGGVSLVSVTCMGDILTEGDIVIVGMEVKPMP